MKYIGAHVSVKGGVSNAPLEAARIGAKAFALFTGSSNRWASKAISEEETERFKANCEAGGFSPAHILPHDNFLINLGSPDPQKLEMSRKSFIDEMRRCSQLGLTMLNFHPGSHLKEIPVDDCLDLIAESINISLDQTEGVTAVIESTAGQGSNLGYEFGQIAHIIDKVEDKTRVGVCVDTCHTYSAGYDLRSEEGYAKTWNDFDRIIGAEYLRALHLNDDKSKGTPGEEFFIRLVNDPRFDNMPLILETPNDAIWHEEIAWLYSQIKE